MTGRFKRVLVAVAAVGAMLALSAAPVGAQDFDEEAASAEVESNLVELFDQLAIAGNAETDAADVDAALARAAELIEGGDTDEVKAQIPGIAGLAAAADLSIVVDESPTFDEAQTTATYIFSALSFGNPSQVNEANGIHVLENGTWKLSSQIWAAFVALGGDSEPEDVDDGADTTESTDEEVAATDEELASTGLSSDALAVLALAVIGAGTMFVSQSRRIRFND